MNIKRLLSTILGLPAVVLVLAFGNTYFIDAAFAIVALISMYEYFNALKEKANPVKWLGYLSALMIAFIHLIPNFNLIYVTYAIPFIVAILFMQSLFTKMKYTIKDISITLFGICYISLFILFIPLISGNVSCKIYLWYIIIAAWGTDIFAYLVGKVFKLGKHKFSKISPNKSIEGCVGGTLGALLIAVIYTYICNVIFKMQLSYVEMSLVTVVLSILSQIGDFSASSIKRYTEMKDFGDLIPGHGGMLDRMDSVIFIAPFAYLLYMVIL